MPLLEARVVLVSALVVAGLACREDAEPPTAAHLDPPLALTADQPLAFRQVSVGEDHSCGVTTANAAYCWGGNGSGELGIGSTTGPESCLSSPCSTRPVRVRGGLAFRQVSATGRFHTCGVTTANVAYCWGRNVFGELGDGSRIDSPRPVRVAGGLAFRQVSAGSLHTCGVTTQDVAYCWGHNQAGPLGDGTRFLSDRPVRVARTLAFREVTAGEQFTCGVTTDDAVWCWGLNGSGQLGIGDVSGPEFCFTGDGSPPCSTRPVRVIRGLAFRDLDAGGAHICGVTTDHVAYCWGDNSSAQLGHHISSEPWVCLGDEPCFSTRPVRVARRLAFAEVSSGVGHTCGVTTGNVAYCWGSNPSGELGIGTTQGPETCFNTSAPEETGFPCSTRPVAVAGEHAFTGVAAGLRFSCGVKTNRVAFCWGANGSGQLGDGTTQLRPRPRRVASGG
jgi:alpha-tubulin suppressor-like RCC1 family protein